MRNTVTTVQTAKSANAPPLVCLTAYTAPMAALLDEQCDILLVGDSVAMVVYGHPSTLQADMEMMIRHGEAVMRATQNALIVVDMPFGSYQESKETAFRNAAEILRRTGAAAVKVEGGAEMADTVSYLSARGIPVMGHIGLQPQSVNTMGGYKAQGKSEDSAARIKADAQAIANAGAFAIVIEGVAEAVAASITRAVACPTIGIGASAACDGQILVTDDMLGIIEGKKPKFVKAYADLAPTIRASVARYAEEVKNRSFPDKAHLYHASKGNSDESSDNAAPYRAPISEAMLAEAPTQTSAAPQAVQPAQPPAEALTSELTQQAAATPQTSSSYQRLGLRPAASAAGVQSRPNPPASRSAEALTKPQPPLQHPHLSRQTSDQKSGLFGRSRHEAKPSDQAAPDIDNTSPFTLRATRRPSGD